MDTTHHASTRHEHVGGTTSDFIDITQWGSFHGSNHNSEHTELVGGRTPITTEALVAYNGLRAFAGLKPVAIKDVGRWAFKEGLTNNAKAWGNDLQGVGLWYAMQGAKVGWIADSAFKPELLADLLGRVLSETEVVQAASNREAYFGVRGLESTRGHASTRAPWAGAWASPTAQIVAVEPARREIGSAASALARCRAPATGPTR